MQVIFWTEDNFCFTSDCKNSFNCKLKKLINEKIIIFYGPWNALCSAGKSRQIKQFKHHTFSGLCSLFPRFSLQIYNFFQWRHIESSTDWANVQICVIEKQPPRGVFKKRRSENMQQIYSRTLMPKCDFNKVANWVYIVTFVLQFVRVAGYWKCNNKTPTPI